MKKITIILQPGYSLVVIVDKLHLKVDDIFISIVWKELLPYTKNKESIVGDVGHIELHVDVPESIIDTIKLYS